MALCSLQTRWLCFSVQQPALIYSPMLICNFTAYGPQTMRDELSTLVCSLDSEEGWKSQGSARALRAAVAVVTSLLSGTHASSVQQDRCRHIPPHLTGRTNSQRPWESVLLPPGWHNAERSEQNVFLSSQFLKTKTEGKEQLELILHLTGQTKRTIPGQPFSHPPFKNDQL